MITISNYYEKLQTINVNELDDTLKETAEFVNEVSKNGKDWTLYEADQDIRETINLYFEKLDAFIQPSEKENKPSEPVQPKVKNRPPAKRATPSTRRKAATTPRANQAAKKKATKAIVPQPNAQLINAFPDEIQLIRRTFNLNGKEKTKHQLLLLINAIQRKIMEKKIRKTSPYASHIKFIQNWLIKTHNEMGEKVLVNITPKRLTEFSKLLGEQQIRPSVKLIRRYINLHGKQITHNQVRSLHNAIANGINKEHVQKSDPYYDQLKEIIKSLRDFNCQVGKKKTLNIHRQTLKGLQGILDGCECDEELGSLEPVTQNRIMNSLDIQKLEFERLGFQGRWLDLIGDPSPGFTTMIYGKPKMGKSYLAVDFAGYLAEHHGRVLYVAKEEQIDATLQQKINEKDVAHQDLDFSGFLPNDLKGYEFVFLDSITKLHLTPEDLDELRARYPHTSFVFIFQTTKGGNFRGRNDFQHDVDVVIEVPEKGRAVQYGRFNQGGEIEIFG